MPEDGIFGAAAEVDCDIEELKDLADLSDLFRLSFGCGLAARNDKGIESGRGGSVSPAAPKLSFSASDLSAAIFCASSLFARSCSAVTSAVYTSVGALNLLMAAISFGFLLTGGEVTILS